MKELIKKNKAVIRFLLIFFGCYLLLAGVYKLYLNYGASSEYYPDYVTHLVAKQSKDLISVLGYKAEVHPHPNNPSMKMYINDHYLARVVEGCNAISVIIMFVAFVLAFHAGIKKTLLFAFAGSVIIYGLNIVRIALFTIALYEYPRYQTILHDIVFPAIIYGIVFVLWFFWAKYVTRVRQISKAI